MSSLLADEVLVNMQVYRTQPDQIRVDIYNLHQGESVSIYLGTGDLGVPELHGEGIISSPYFINSLQPDENYSVVARFVNANLDQSFTVDSETDDWYDLIPNEGVTVTDVERTVAIPWGEDINAAMLELTNLVGEEGELNRKQISIGENRTLL